MSITRRILLASAAATALFVLWLFAVWPPPAWYRTHFPRETAFMRMRGGIEAYRPVPLDSISRHFPRAVLVGEDHRFWTHRGIDFIEVRRALGYRRDGFSWTSPRDMVELGRALGGAWERREALRGASTISQQLAKNLYLSPSRNPLRKLKEAVTAYRLELALGKERVLELYVNVAELGDGVWGVEAASRAYFGRPAASLTRSEAAALAGSLPFPLASNPSHQPGRMRWRQAYILRRMQGGLAERPPDLPRKIPEALADSISRPVVVEPEPEETLAAPVP
ncbi:MAG: transglycosylase domain-containing protein [Gemmatimonadota bacterium]